LKPAGQIVHKTLSCKNPSLPTKKRSGGVAEGVGPEFKPQYCKKKDFTETHKNSTVALDWMKSPGRTCVKRSKDHLRLWLAAPHSPRICGSLPYSSNLVSFRKSVRFLETGAMIGASDLGEVHWHLPSSWW
jgi:hypothetical protein